MFEKRHLPDANRVSVLASVILLAYALMRIIATPDFLLNTRIGGENYSLTINLNILVSFLIAGLTATGIDWLLHGHPLLKDGSKAQHLLVPALTAWALSVPLYSLSGGVLWWGVFGLGGLFMVLVFLSEYIVVDPGDSLYGLASALLTALSFTLFLLLIVNLRFTEGRLYLQLPAMGFAAGLVSLRTINLRLHGRWDYIWAVGISLVAVQLAAGWHYWAMTPVQFGLAMLAPVFALTNLAVNLGEDTPASRVWTELGITFLVLWSAALLIG